VERYTVPVPLRGASCAALPARRFRWRLRLARDPISCYSCAVSAGMGPRFYSRGWRVGIYCTRLTIRCSPCGEHIAKTRTVVTQALE